MKRAEVFKDDELRHPWVAQVVDGTLTERDIRIRWRSDCTYPMEQAEFPTHTAALAHALAEVGLTEKKENAS